MVRASVLSSKHGVSGLHFTYSDEHRVEIELGEGDPEQRKVSDVELGAGELIVGVQVELSEGKIVSRLGFTVLRTQP